MLFPLQNVLRQVSGDSQFRNPIHLIDSHPDGPTNSLGSPIIYDQVGMGPLAPVPWKQNLLVQVVSLWAYTQAGKQLQSLVKKKPAATTAANKQQVSVWFVDCNHLLSDRCSPAFCTSCC